MIKLMETTGFILIFFKKCFIIKIYTICIGACIFNRCKMVKTILQNKSVYLCVSAVCHPVCENNGSCVAPDVCICPAGYEGPTCAKGKSA